MNSTLRMLLLVASLIVFVFVLSTVAKKKMNIKFSIIWIIWSILIVFITLFPSVVFKITKILGIEMPSNAIFLIMIFILYCTSFYVFLIISKQSSEITRLNYEVANINKKIETLKKKD